MNSISNNTKKEGIRSSQVVITGKKFDFNSKSFKNQLNEVKKEVKKIMDNSNVDPQKLSINFTV